NYVKQGTNQNMGFLRYTAAGHLDSTFSGDGKQVLDFGGPENVRAMTVQGDGKIVAVGAADGSKFAAVRLKGGGSVDTGFGSGGMTSAPLSGPNVSANDV